MRLLLKMFFVGGMTIAIMIPLMLIRGTISERQYYRNEAVANIARSSAGAQAFSLRRRCACGGDPVFAQRRGGCLGAARLGHGARVGRRRGRRLGLIREPRLCGRLRDRRCTPTRTRCAAGPAAGRSRDRCTPGGAGRDLQR